MAIFGLINSLIAAGKQNKLARGINPVNTTYAESAADSASFSPYVKELYGEGKNLYQGRMAGAGAAEQNLLTGVANFGAGVDKNATSGSQAIAAKAAGLGSMNQGFANLATQESQNKQQRFGIYSNVSQLMAQEGQNVYQDKLRKYYDDLNYKRALEGAAMQNKATAWQGLDDTVMAAANLFAPGVGLLAGKEGGGKKAVVEKAVVGNNQGRSLGP